MMFERLYPVIAAAGIGLVLSAGGAMAGDAAAGKAVFINICSMCHSNQAGQNRIGPSLFGVFDRKSGTLPGYHYSPAAASANVVWDQPTLDRYLQAPRTVVPGTKMTYAGLKDETKRENLITYLETLK
jgi:cytochrome c